MQAVTRLAAEKAGVAPASGHSLKWFAYGDQTGLMSAEKTITDLLNERINVTAQMLGETPEKTWQMIRTGAIPLMAKGGAVRPPGAIARASRRQNPGAQIARNSSFTYKGRAVDIKRVGRELGVRYVLEGAYGKPAAASA
jgi:hypothetical protein